jgi:hypothetical protein
MLSSARTSPMPFPRKLGGPHFTLLTSVTLFTHPDSSCPSLVVVKIAPALPLLLRLERLSRLLHRRSRKRAWNTSSNKPSAFVRRPIQAKPVLQVLLHPSANPRRLLSITLLHLRGLQIPRPIRRQRSCQVPSRLLHRFANKSSLLLFSHVWHQLQ